MEEEKKVAPISEETKEPEANENEVVEAEVFDDDEKIEEAPAQEDATLFEKAPEEEEEGFVDDVSKKQQEEKAAKEEEIKASAEEKKAEGGAANADGISPMRIPSELEGGATQIVIPANEKGQYDYPDEKLASIEAARQKWVKSYRVGSIVKISISVVLLAAIILGWIIPTRVMGSDAGQVPLYIALGIAAVALVGMGLVSFFVKKQQKGVVATYFKEYYAGFDGYTMDIEGVDNVAGSVDDKVSKEEFEAGKVFENAYSVGSRDSITFDYKGIECALAAAAGQEQRDKRIATSFVGKFLRMHNNLNVGEDGVVIYLKGNDRAIPPTSLITRTPAIEDPSFNVYGRDKYIEALPKEAMEKMKNIQTDKLLVDVTISIQSGRTFFYLGYEDTLMVLPNKDPYNPNYAIAYKKQLAKFLEIGELLAK
ncbi:MAG: hypothetical protein K6B65_07175 [Bacilli bacterium]|nr:hypothetical protein [Bacilli bacterium]